MLKENAATNFGRTRFEARRVYQPRDRRSTRQAALVYSKITSSAEVARLGNVQERTLSIVENFQHTSRRRTR